MIPAGGILVPVPVEFRCPSVSRVSLESSKFVCHILSFLQICDCPAIAPELALVYLWKAVNLCVTFGLFPSSVTVASESVRDGMYVCRILSFPKVCEYCRMIYD